MNNKKTPQKKKGKKQVNDIKVYALGGLGVVGMNMYVIEFLNEIVVIDAGILFAGGEEHGVDYIIPDTTYLKENEDKIVGLFITHGHEDHIGGIPFLLKNVKIPAIYASGLATSLIENKMREYPNLSYNMIRYNDDSVYTFKNFTLSFFRTTHSIPDSCGIAIKTKLGNIIYTGDFKFDFTPIGRATDYYKLTKLGEDGVLCLLSDSTNSTVEDFSVSERKIAETLHALFSQLKGRIIVATFASNVYRVQQIISASAHNNRKVFVFGRSMEKTIQAATKMKYINVPKGTIVNSRSINSYPPEEVTILCTGTQGEPMAALSRIANGTHKQIKLVPGDTVIFSSKAIPGNEQFINRNINKLVKAGAEVIRNSPLTDIHTTGHASENELKMMFAFLKPKYFVPAHGEYFMLKKHANIAISMGVKKENCFILDPGDVLSLNSRGSKLTKDGVYVSDIYLDSNLSDVDSNILKERKHLADEGLLTAVFTIDKHKKVLAPTQILTKGFLDDTSSNDLVNDIKRKADEIFSELLKHYKHINERYIKSKFTQQLSQYLYDKIEHKPFIVPIMMII